MLAAGLPRERYAIRDFHFKLRIPIDRTQTLRTNLERQHGRLFAALVSRLAPCWRRPASLRLILLASIMARGASEGHHEHQDARGDHGRPILHGGAQGVRHSPRIRQRRHRFAPIIEGILRNRQDGGDMPEFVTVPHEHVAVAMAQGYYLMSGKMAGAMVHVNVGTANTICALMNAARNNTPMFLASGRSPSTETGDAGSRDFWIHWLRRISTRRPWCANT